MMCAMKKGELEALLAYLLTRPYGEVENAVGWCREALSRPSTGEPLSDSEGQPVLVAE